MTIGSSQIVESVLQIIKVFAENAQNFIADDNKLSELLIIVSQFNVH